MTGQAFLYNAIFFTYTGAERVEERDRHARASSGKSSLTDR
jgi:hypothetical protein